jgi:hypothetical protein
MFAYDKESSHHILNSHPKGITSGIAESPFLVSSLPHLIFLAIN